MSKKAIDLLSLLIEESLTELAQQHSFVQPAGFKVLLEHPADTTYGEYATNSAMTLFSQLKQSKQTLPFANPRALAEALVLELQNKILKNVEYTSMVKTVSLAGPGFINFTLSDAYLFNILKQSTDDVLLTQSLKLSDWKDKKVVMEFTDPNPFKQLHIGHAYSNSVGESITRLLKAVGADVSQACYQGDVGMHVAKSVWGLLNVVLPSMDRYVELQKNNTQLETVTILMAELEQSKSPLLTDSPVDALAELLGQAYAKGDAAYKDDEVAQAEIKECNFLTFLSAQQWLVEEHNWQPQIDYSQFVDPNNKLYAVVKQVYQTGRRWSMEYFEILYGRLGMTKKESGKYFDYYFAESVVGEYGLKIVQEYLAKGIFKKSNGAVIFPGSEYGLHDRVFVNSLGLPTYETKELGLAPEKYRTIPYDLSIIMTANEIDEYFKVLIKAIEQIRPDLAAKTKHLSHGVVKLPEGKMSSRTGNVITTYQLLEQAEQTIEATLVQSRPEMSQNDRKKIASKVGLAAVKYAFLKQDIGGDIAFSFDDSLSFTGQSGPYLQYSYVRCLSILNKNNTLVENIAFEQLSINSEERAVLVLLAQFSECVAQAATEYRPHIVAHFAFQLAQTFTRFYTNCPIIKEENHSQKQFRLLLTKATATVLAKSMNLLGIETVEEM